MRSSPLALWIATAITAKISAGDLPAGSHLATEALAQEFQVSRSPVREALSMLSSRGLIENRKNCGFFVRNGGTIQESYGLRLIRPGCLAWATNGSLCRV